MWEYGLFFDLWDEKISRMRSSGIEPEPYPWQGQILPLNYERSTLSVEVFFGF